MEQIVGQYILERKIGEGGMAEVWQGTHVHLGNIVAVKFLLPSYSGDPQMEERFLEEGKRQAGLQHPNIVSANDFLQVDGHSYLVMQYVEGQSLEDRLQAHRGPLPLEEVHAISWDVLSALDYAHSQTKPLVHRDVKPSNILIENTGRVLLSDFGIALVMGADRRLTRTDIAIGTSDYMSPEQILRPKEVDPRSDIYSFGCVLYAMLTGAPPFSSEGATDFSVKDGHVRGMPPPMTDRNPTLSPFVERVVLTCMEKDPATRYQTCRAVMKALDEAMKTAPSTPAPPPLPPRPTSPPPSIAARPPAMPPPAVVPPPVAPSAPFMRREVPPAATGKRRGALLLAAAGIIAAAAAAWFFWPSQPQTVLRLEGSTTIGDALAPALLEAFARSEGGADIATPEKKIVDEGGGVKSTHFQIRATMPGNSHPEIFEVVANGSGNAFKALKNKTADVGMASRRVNDKETADLQDVGEMKSPASEIVLGMDGIAIVVNRNNPVTTLTRKEIAAIFSGRVSNWSEFGGHAQPIGLYGRNSDSGTYDSFVAMVFGGKKSFSPGLQTKDNGEAIAEAVASDPGGIGYVGLPQIGAAKALEVSDGPGTSALLPSPFTVATEDYVLSRRLYLYLPQNPSPLARRFAAFAQRPEGQAIVKQIHFVEQTGEFQTVPVSGSAPSRYQEIVNGKRRSKVNFRFEPGSDDLDTKALADIDRVVTALSAANVKDVYLLGFADNKGSYEKNLGLSENRARVVAAKLQAAGVTVHPEGFSYDMPVADNGTEDGRAKNRRVEVWVP
jgi:phosphate transport system substrate-binding protein